MTEWVKSNHWTTITGKGRESVGPWAGGHNFFVDRVKDPTQPSCVRYGHPSSGYYLAPRHHGCYCELRPLRPRQIPISLSDPLSDPLVPLLGIAARHFFYFLPLDSSRIFGLPGHANLSRCVLGLLYDIQKVLSHTPGFDSLSGCATRGSENMFVLVATRIKRNEQSIRLVKETWEPRAGFKPVFGHPQWLDL